MATIPEQDQLQAHLDELVAEHEVVGAAAGVLVGDEVVAAAAGLANKDTGLEATPDTLFQIGSVTKVYTATLVMQLVDDGLVALDDRVADHLGGATVGNYEEAGDITVRQLLCHTSGMAGDHFADFGRGDDAIERFVDGLVDQPRVHAPGEIMSYCNAGYVVLGRLVELLREMPWHAAVTAHITDPIGATDTVTLPEDAVLRRVAVGHMGDPEDPSAPATVAPVWSLTPAMSPAGAQTCATPADLLAFARLHLEEGTARDGTQVLSPASAKAMQEPQVDLPSRAVLNAESWGLGWILFDWDGARVIGHDGATFGQGCFLRLVPDQDLAIAIHVNDSRRGKKVIADLSRRLFDEVAGITVPGEPTALEDPGDRDLSVFCGTYAQENYEVRVRSDDGALVADIVPTTEHAKQMMAAKHHLPLRPTGGGDFLLDDEDGSSPLTFANSDQDGRPKFLHMGARALPRTD